MSDLAMELPTGTIVDSAYRISAPVRLTKDGDVYLGEPIAPGPPVMIHILRTALMEGDPGLETFERAGLELCRFSHDAFPEVVDYGRFMVRPYLITEQIDARPLTEIIAAGELSSDHALRVVNETRKALQAAHSAGMAHGALTPDNIFITPDGDVKILGLFTRWIAQQVHTRGAPIDNRADLNALLELSQTLLKCSKPVAPVAHVEDAQVLSEAPVNIASDLEIKLPSLSDLAANEEDSDDDDEAEASSPWAEFTPEPDVEYGPPPTVVAMPIVERPEPKIIAVPKATPPPVPAPTLVVTRLGGPALSGSAFGIQAEREPEVRLQPKLPPPPARPSPVVASPVVASPVVASTKSSPKGAPAMKVRLPPPPASTSPALKAPKPVLPATPPPPAPRPAIQVMAKQTLPPPAPRVPRPRVVSATGAVSVELDGFDELLGPQLRPGYIDFFKRFFHTQPRTDGSENGASRSFNLLLTCSIALLMLAAVLRF